LRTKLSTLRTILATGATRQASWRDLRSPGARADLTAHLDAAIDWLCRAQDAVDGGGVSYGYDVRAGFLPPYPETTGYIIVTVLEYVKRHENRLAPDAGESLRERARRMARWLTTVQLESGALPGGTTAVEPRPTIFNTGQILQGWVAADREFGDAEVHDSLVRAARWLADVQDEDGCWRRHMSPLTLQSPATYNARSASALLAAGIHLGDDRICSAAVRNFDWVLTQQRPNGWFENNCLTDLKRPLTHTIGYTMEGLLDAAEMTGAEKYAAAVALASEPLMRAVGADGFLAGRFDSTWTPAVGWNCLTGASQIALVWFKYARMSGNAAYSEHARRLLDYVRATQHVCGPRPSAPEADTCGAIKGSHPIWGGYDPFRYPNWAAKFFADAIMAADSAAETGGRKGR